MCLSFEMIHCKEERYSSRSNIGELPRLNYSKIRFPSKLNYFTLQSISCLKYSNCVKPYSFNILSLTMITKF